MANKSKKRGNKRFARIYDKSMRVFEEKFGHKYRGGLLQNLQGAVLEIGVGTGANFPHYPRHQMSRLVGIEPDYYMLEQAQAKRAQVGLDIELVKASAEKLPFKANEFDAIVTTLVLCTVPNLAPTLTEIRRVLKPGGKLYFFEHVANPNRLAHFIQVSLNPIWGWAAGGCKLNRDTTRALEQAGFKFEKLERLHLVPLSPINPQIWGIAF